MKNFTLPDLMLVLGLVCLVGGVAAFDWRMALIVFGVLLLAGGVVGLTRGK